MWVFAISLNACPPCAFEMPRHGCDFPSELTIGWSFFLLSSYIDLYKIHVLNRNVEIVQKSFHLSLCAFLQGFTTNTVSGKINI